MIDECPMTEDCPGCNRDRRVCLLRPADWEFAPADGEAGLITEKLRSRRSLLCLAALRPG